MLHELGYELKQSIEELSTKRDQHFIKHLMVPLLNSEEVIPICFHFYDPINNRMIDQAKKILLYMRMNRQKKLHERETKNLDSKIFREHEKTEFFKHFQ